MQKSEIFLFVCFGAMVIGFLLAGIFIPNINQPVKSEIEIPLKYELAVCTAINDEWDNPIFRCERKQTNGP